MSTTLPSLISNPTPTNNREVNLRQQSPPPQPYNAPDNHRVSTNSEEQQQQKGEELERVFVAYDDNEAGVFRSLGQHCQRTVLPVMVAAMARYQDEMVSHQTQQAKVLAMDVSSAEGEFESGVSGLGFTLPSDYTWRTKIYLKLLKKQKEQAKLTMDDPDFNPDDRGIDRGSSDILHDWNIIPATPKVFCAPNAERLSLKERAPLGPGPITWTVNDLAKAGSLLLSPPLPVRFADEQEMRRVYTLIFDVYRYKGILNKALNDVQFFILHPELEAAMSRVWLLLFDMYHMQFKKRDPKHAAEAQLSFRPAHLLDVARILWQERVKLAASVARLRIKNSALRLNKLLPAHLRDERVQAHAQRTPVTCWVNYRKIKNMGEINALISRVLKLGCLEDAEGTLTPDTFKWDSHCPSFLLFHPSVRTQLAQCSLVQTNKLVVQDRSFCFGPATFDKILTNLQLTGNVIQSHVNSPRTTAYLASLLSYNEKIKKLLAFSAGSRKNEYDHYFSELGLKNVSTYAEKLSDIPANAHYLEDVIAVFATPPNSYTAVADPIDLVCSRGGDLSMLEILTESEDTPQGRKRVLEILNEQRKTLYFAMAKPQIQLVLYETHSELDAENNAMIQKTVKEINQITRMHHANLQGKLRKKISADCLDFETADEELGVIPEGSQDDFSLTDGIIEIEEQEITETPAPTQVEEDFYKDIIVPDCDIFDVPSIPELCKLNDCVNILEQGCFLALIQRKEVTKLDNKYMIQMAETRGLFGDTDSKASKKKSIRSDKNKKTDIPVVQPKKRRGKAIEIERIAAPTIASIQQSRIHSLKSGNCPREIELELQSSKSNQTRRWWHETTRHITNLRTSLSRQKIISTTPKSLSYDHNANATAKAIVGTLLQEVQYRKVDEIVARASKKSVISGTIPVFPRLRLTRNVQKVEKVPVPLAITMDVETNVPSLDTTSKKICISNANNNAEPSTSHVSKNYSYCGIEMQKLAYQLELDVKTKSTVKKHFSDWNTPGKKVKTKRVNKKGISERLLLGTQSSIKKESRFSEDAQVKMSFKM